MATAADLKKFMVCYCFEIKYINVEEFIYLFYLAFSEEVSNVSDAQQ